MAGLILTGREASSVEIAIGVSIEAVERAIWDPRTTEVDREDNEQMLRDLLAVQKKLKAVQKNPKIKNPITDVRSLVAKAMK